MERTKTKLCGCGETNIPVGGKIRVMCEFRDAKQKSEFLCGENRFQESTQFTHTQRIMDNTNTQRSNTKRLRKRKTWKEIKKRAEANYLENVPKSLQRSGKDGTLTSHQAEGRYFTKSAST